MASHVLLSAVRHEHSSAQQGPFEPGHELVAAGHDVTIVYTSGALLGLVTVSLPGRPEGAELLSLAPSRWADMKPKKVERERSLVSKAGFTEIDVGRFHEVVSSADVVLTI